MKKGVIRVEANPNIGLGHATRAISLCEMLLPEASIAIAFRDMPEKTKQEFIKLGCDLICLDKISTSDEYSHTKRITGKIDFVIVDGYSFLDRFKKDTKSCGDKLVLIDDNADLSFEADLVINHSPGLKPTNYPLIRKSNLCLGLDYVMLRSEFLNRTKNLENKKEIKKGILVCLGGSDPMKLSNKIVDLLLSYTDEIIHCVIGELNSNFDGNYTSEIINERLFLYKDLTSLEMRILMSRSKAGICTSSTISLECIATRLPIVVGWLEDNQKNIYDGITKKGLALGIGKFEDLNQDQISSLIISLIENNKIRKNMIDSQISNLDLKSTSRIKEAILKV